MNDKNHCTSTYIESKTEAVQWENPSQQSQGSCQEQPSATADPASSPLLFQIAQGITLREIRIQDAAAIFRTIDTHREYLRTWLPFVDAMRTAADEENFLKGVLSVSAEKYDPIFGVVNEPDEICGLVGFHFSDPDNHRTEIGYWLVPEYQHRGIITAAVRSICLWTVKNRGTHRIQIRCAAGNVASNRIPLRLGFKLEGTERDGELLATGEYTDILVYSILEEEVLEKFATTAGTKEKGKQGLP